MGDATEVTSDAFAVNRGDQQVERAMFWGVRHRKPLIGVIAFVFAGGGAGWKGLEQIEAVAEERVIRRQAAELQSKQVIANGEAVGKLGTRLAHVETSIAEHAELTRMGLELLMASPSVAAVLELDPGLRARAAKAVSSGTD